MDINIELKNYTKEDIEQAQDRDFEHWVYDLNYRIQKIADKINPNLNNKISKKDKAIVDITFINIESILEQTEKLLIKTK